ncbi:DUF596 domain-containing protein, partial [Variovorax sp. VNK109]|uniref:DUF596 domain-containing protein n=1 Tax=Variovorax sp. VNK109 TaxID=3400919 RepID=UPI003C08ADA6
AISDALFKEYADDSTSGSLALLWSNVPYHWSTFEEHRDVFLWVFERLLREGRIKLHKNGVFLEGSIEEQVEAFRKAFPSSEEDADKRCTKPGYEPAYEGFGMNVWWFLDICPAGVAWRRPDGSYQIAD